MSRINIQLERLILTFLLFLLSLIPILSLGKSCSITLEILHLVMSFICSFAMFSYVDKPYSCFKVFHLFYYFYFAIAPILQFKNNIYIFGTHFSEGEYIHTSFLLLFGLIVFDVIYMCLFEINITHSSTKNNKEVVINKDSFSARKKVMMFVISFLVFLLFLYINKFNMMALFTRDSFSQVAMNQSLYLIVDHLIRPLPLFLFLVSLRLEDKFLSASLFVFFFLSNPFTGMPRNSGAAMYIPVLLWSFPIFRKRQVFVFIISIALLVIFPFLNKFRHVDNINSFEKISFELNFSQFLDMNFDSYSMFMRVLKTDIVTNGNQLLGVIFFWVPRSLWPGKAIGSGAYIAHETHLSFTNLSMPYMGEGYLNFGILGIIIFSVVLAYIFAILDSNYWKYNNENNFSSLKYYLILGLVMFIMRGDLLSSFAYTIGYIMSFYLAKKLLFNNNCINENEN